jgi:DNA invertase Pin-like site-specific DNA recombinase
MGNNDVTPAMLRAEAAAALEAPGARRKSLRAELDEAESELRPLIRKAVAAEVPTRKIQELTGVSRVTITRWSQTPGE